jgi:hypothetical protein
MLPSIGFYLALLLASADAVDPALPLSATDLAARLSAWQQDGISYTRLRMEVTSPDVAKTAVQIQVKARRTKAGSEAMYQVLWPKERKGEGVLIRKARDGSAGGATFVPPDNLRALDASQMGEPLFGSDLSLEDLVDNVFAWKNQVLVGTEDLEGTSCYVLESKPGKGDRSPFAAVRTWVDSRRLIPIRIEKYMRSGRVARRIDTANVVTDDIGRPIPSKATVRGTRKDSVTELDGSRIKHDITYPVNQFTPEALRELTIPRSAPD